jgi:hypothetical protein
MTKRTTQAQADSLFTGVLAGWVTLTDGLTDIVARKAWKPLGYPTFVDAWRERLSDLSLSVKALTIAVYAMLDESTPEEIAAVVEGITIEGIESLIRQRDNGVPEESASPFRGRRRAPQTTIFIHVGAERHAYYEELARLADRTLTEIATKAVEDAFAQIEADLKKRDL